MAEDIVVTGNADSGNGTPRQAIRFNKSLGDGSTILFSNIHPRSAQYKRAREKRFPFIKHENGT